MGQAVGVGRADGHLALDAAGRGARRPRSCDGPCWGLKKHSSRRVGQRLARDEGEHARALVAARRRARSVVDRIEVVGLGGQRPALATLVGLERVAVVVARVLGEGGGEGVDVQLASCSPKTVTSSARSAPRRGTRRGAPRARCDGAAGGQRVATVAPDRVSAGGRTSATARTACARIARPSRQSGTQSLVTRRRPRARVALPLLVASAVLAARCRPPQARADVVRCRARPRAAAGQRLRPRPRAVAVRRPAPAEAGRTYEQIRGSTTPAPRHRHGQRRGRGC